MSQSLTVDDFSGGITDNYVNADQNRAQEMDNLVLEYHGNVGKLRTRYGSHVFDLENARAASGSVADLRKFEGQNLKTIGNAIYQYIDSDIGWHELRGYGDVPAFSSLTTVPRPSFTEWNGHLLTSQERTNKLNPANSCFPVKIFQEATITANVTVASDVISFTTVHPFMNGMLVEFTSATPITGLTDGTVYEITDVVKTLTTSSFKLSTVAGAPVSLTNGSYNAQKFEPKSFKLVTAGLPLIDSSGIGITKSGTGNTYLYAFVYRYDYNVDTREYLDVGPVSAFKTLANVGTIDGANAAAIATIPVLANQANAKTKYELNEIKVEIYRTIAAGSTFFYVGEVLNGTTSFNDNVPDATLLLRRTLYITGGVVDNDHPPEADLVHVTATDVAMYARQYDGTQFLDNTVSLSVPGDIDAVPADNTVEVEDVIIGISSVRAYGIVLCRNSAYRLEGVYDLLGNGVVQRIKISDTCSCVSPQSVVQTLEGVFWAGEDAFYYTDGFQVIKINEDWPNRYAELEDKGYIYGKYDSYNRRVAWGARVAISADVGFNRLFVLNIRAGIKTQASFTTYSNGDYFRPTAIEFDGDTMLRGDTRGYVFEHTPDDTTDPKIDTAVAASLWNKVHIPYVYKGAAMNFGVDIVRKYATNVVVTCKNQSNLSLQVVTNNDDNKKISNLKPIRFRGNLIWGDPTIVWGDPDLIWNFDGIIENRRWFPSKTLRFSYKQIQLMPAFVAILSSDDLDEAEVDANALTVDLSSYVDPEFDWPDDVVDYFIAFESDGYTLEKRIISRTDKVLTLESGAEALTGGFQKWVIRGYPKGEVMNLLSYTIGYVVFGDTQDSFSKRGTGEVGAGSYGAE